MSFRVCPRCSGHVEVRRLGNHFHVRCKECGASHHTQPGEVRDAVAAYLRFMDIMERGEPAQPARMKKPSIRSKPKPQVQQQVSSQELIKQLKAAGIPEIDRLPKAIQRILTDSTNHLVNYRAFPETIPELGCKIEEAPIKKGLQEALQRQGVTQLFKFQEEAIQHILEGKNVVISAPTATGKTEAFALPIFEQITKELGGWGPLRPAEKRAVRALFIYPTKALARDQAQKLATLAASVGMDVAVLDGDTSKTDRTTIYQHPPEILITNPDMLHVHLVRPRDPMRRLMKTVRHVVLDELHVYVGAFGANVHFLLKRLQRLCPPLQLIGASATVSNAREFAELLFDRPVVPIFCDQGKKGLIHFLMLYPERTSQSTMIANIAQELVRQNFKTLVFANTHRNAEVINLIARRIRLRSAVHRAGLPMTYRNLVEDDFRQGNLDLLVSTPTLELGIDIGDLDAVVSMLVGITRLTQRIGRAGRKGQESIAVLALRNNDAISSYYREHPDDYFTDIDPAYVEPQNEVVARHQLLAASLDKPLTLKEFPAFQKILQELADEGLLQKTGQTLRANLSAARRELSRYNIRGIGDTVQIVYAGKIIGERQMPIAQAELHPGAYYLHAGKTYEAIEFEFRHGVGRAELEQLSPNHREMTQALRHVNPEITQVRDTRTAYGITLYYADLRMTEVVTGFVTKDIYTDKILKTQDLDHPLEYTYPTKGFFFTAPPPIKTVTQVLDQPSELLKYHDSQSTGAPELVLEKDELVMGTFHAVEHSIIESSDMLTGGGSQGIGGVSMGTSGVIFIYDGSPGGSGLSKLLYDRVEEAFRRVSFILRNCSCQTLDGCPACTYSYRCGNNNRPLFRAGANEVADLIISGTQTTTDEKGVPAEEPLI